MKHITRIEQDLYPENPREWQNWLGTLCYQRERYDTFTGGDKKGIDKLYDAVYAVYNKGKMTVSDSYDMDYEIDFNDAHQLVKLFVKYNMGIILPIWVSGNNWESLSCGDMNECSEDNGQRGYIFVTHEDIRNYFNVKSINNTHKEKVVSILKDEVRVYSAWCEGDVYRVLTYSIDEDKELELYVNHELEIDDSDVWNERDWQDALPYLEEGESYGEFYGYSEAVEYVKDMKENMQ